MNRVLILGAGFGGLELATRLCELLPGEVDVTLVDQKDHFYVGFMKIDVLFGRLPAEQVKHHYKDLAAKAVTFKQEQVLSMDLAAKRVVTNGGTYDADVIVLALGADIDPSKTPGLEGNASAFEFYSLEGAARAAGGLAEFSGGRVLVSILGAPYKCPPAPFEVVLQLHDYFERRGIREKVELRIATPAPIPLPVTKEGSTKLLELMTERNIEFSPNTLVTSLEDKIAVTKAGDRLPFDLLLAVPAHRPPKVVGEWVAVDQHTMETKFPGVYAIGDVTTVPVGQGAVPKAGAFADRAAGAVADDIVHRIRGTGARGHFDGVGACYLEFGEGRVAMIDANYLGGPTPNVAFVGPSPDLLPKKTAFATERIARWFRQERQRETDG